MIVDLQSKTMVPQTDNEGSKIGFTQQSEGIRKRDKENQIKKNKYSPIFVLTDYELPTVSLCGREHNSMTQISTSADN